MGFWVQGRIKREERAEARGPAKFERAESTELHSALSHVGDGVSTISSNL